MEKNKIETTEKDKKQAFYEILNRIIPKGDKTLDELPAFYKPISKSKNLVKEPTIHYGSTNKVDYISYSDNCVIESIRCGIKFENFKCVYSILNFSNSKWAEIIGVSERTMQHILKAKRNLDQNKAEKLVSFLLFVKYALNVLGDFNNFFEWFNYKSPVLEGNTPLDYVDTFQGIAMLREQLFKIETGNLV